MKKILALIVAFAFLGGLLAGCQAFAAGFELTSPAFKHGESIPQKYARPAAGGRNLSIPVKWAGSPQGTQSFALVIVDIHPTANDWVHWMVIDIPAGVTSLPEGASRILLSLGAKEIKNSFGTVGYGGPQPPRGTGPHAYVVTIFALKTSRLDLKPNAGLADFLKATKGKVLKEASIMGYFENGGR